MSPKQRISFMTDPKPEQSRLKNNLPAGYQFLPGGYPYSSGVVAMNGYEILHVTLKRPLPWHDGLHRAQAYLSRSGIKIQALCGVELRCPLPHSIGGFSEFNRDYRQLLEDWDLLVDGENPVARTNVAPVVKPPEETLLHAFSYVQPSDHPARTFVAAGGGELPHREIDRSHIVRLGETTPDAMLEKAQCVARIMQHRMDHLGVAHEDVTTIDVYTSHPIHQILNDVLIPSLPSTSGMGVQWFLSRPPVEEIEFEMDLRGIREELTIGLD